MKMRDLQNQIETLYQLREDGSEDSELGRVTGLIASVGQMCTALHMQLTHSLSVGDMRKEMEAEMLNLLTFLFATCSFYDIDVGEQLEVLEGKVLTVLETWGGRE